MYSEQVLDHFHHPRNVGEIAGAAAVIELSNPVCGDVMKLWAAVRDGKVDEARFKVEGCVPAVACGSWLTERMLGRSVAELRTVTAEEIESGLGGLPQASRHASALAAAALQQWLELTGRE
ncbi:MAG TPA: iron-sulfur cluster assembly scaffold protein [Terriglobia bacterium]|nr:iron-sulfur cluster assembly scaffold protein [Terriglobia bacterium]